MNDAKQTEIDEAHKTLIETFRSGKTKDKEWRKNQLRQAWWMFEDYKEQICEVLYKDLHKHRFEAYSSDVNACQTDILHTYNNLDKWTADEKPSPYAILNFIGGTVVRKEPLGTTLIIGAWNFPFVLLFQPMFAAIAAGCTILLKPSDVATASEKLITEMVAKYMDPDAIRCVTAGPSEMSYLLEKRFNHIFFTGSASVAKIIAAAAAKHLTPTTLELGGQGPAIVTATANIDLAAKRIASTKFLNAGQICLNVNHVLVDPAVRPLLVERLKHYFKMFLEDDTQLPAGYTTIINQRNFDRLEGLLLKTKGKIEYSTFKDRKTLAFGPVIVTGVDVNDSIMSEELFGPILPILEADVHDAIEITTSMEHPLALYIFTSDKSEEQKIINSSISGGVTINDCVLHCAAPDAPFGGVGNSGSGSYHGKYGILAFSHQRTIMGPPTWLDFLFGARYPPYTLEKLAKLSPEGRPPFGRDTEKGSGKNSALSWKTLSLGTIATAVGLGAYLYQG